MIPNQLFPLEVDPQTQEPFLRLRKHKNIIITPMRWDDATHLVPIFNDPLVYKWLRHPLPFTLKDGEELLQIRKPKNDAVLQELLDAQGSEALKIVDACPVNSLREVKEDGTQKFIGNCSFRRSPHMELVDTDTVDWEHAEEKMVKNDALEAGDPRIIYTIGYYLDAAYHAQGIMSDVVDTILHEWAIPRMNVKHFLTGAFKGNRGSVRVFEKNGFVMIRTVDELGLVRGEMTGVHVLEWKAGTEEKLVT